jgi:hypothetical protein
MPMSTSPSPHKASRLPDFKTLAVTACAALVASLATAFSSPASIQVDGRKVVSDVPPVTTVAHGAFVPLRAIALGMGADSSFDPKTGAITFTRGSDTIVMHVGDRAAKLNGAKFTLKQAPFLVRGRAMVSDELLARAFGATVKYDGRTAKIDILTPGVVAGAQDDSTAP